MQSNLDERGVRFRRVWGIMTLTCALISSALAAWSGIWWMWVIAGVGAAAGLFALYEAQQKWCVLRAMGVQTRI